MEIKSFSRKQAGVIYRAFKEGRIEMSKPAVSAMYDMCGEAFITCGNRDYVENCIAAVQLAVSAIFDGDYGQAQRYVACFE